MGYTHGATAKAGYCPGEVRNSRVQADAGCLHHPRARRYPWHLPPSSRSLDSLPLDVPLETLSSSFAFLTGTTRLDGWPPLELPPGDPWLYVMSLNGLRSCQICGLFGSEVCRFPHIYHTIQS